MANSSMFVRPRNTASAALESGDHGGVVRRPKVLEHARAAGGQLAFHAEQVFDGDGKSSEASDRLTGLAPAVHVGGLSECRFAIDAEKCLDLTVALADRDRDTLV